MVERIKYHLDEHVDPDIARALRRYGIDVTTTIGAGLRTLDDWGQLDFVQREKRVIVTHDADFLRYARDCSAHPGVIYGQMGTHRMGDIIRTLILIYEVLTAEEMVGRVEYL